MIHHAGTNGRQRGTSRREDALDTVVALRRPEDYAPEQGARFEIHFEKIRNRVEGVGAVSFEASVDSSIADRQEGIHWSDRDLTPPLLRRAAQQFGEGQTVRQEAASLKISKSEAGRLRLRALDGALPSDGYGSLMRQHPGARRRIALIGGWQRRVYPARGPSPAPDGWILVPCPQPMCRGHGTPPREGLSPVG
jgi:hypothetical protein